ncbi:MAG: hypothetical protein GX979_08550, partial [Firmicutes bacterium]|nr:hypothetical protein [Bacillota bacterium]
MQLIAQGELGGYEINNSWHFTVESVRDYMAKCGPRSSVTTLIKGMEEITTELEGEEKEELQEALEQFKGLAELYATNDKERKIH